MERNTKRKKGKTGWIMLLIVASSAVIFGLLTGFFDSTEKKSDGNWQVVDVTLRDISSSVRATGIIKPMVGAEVRVGSRISGIVRKLHVRIGDKVKKGDLLAELDTNELEALYNQSKAALEKSGADLKYAEIDHKRTNDLIKDKIVSQNDLDLAVRSKDVAELQLKEAEANLKYAEVQLGYTKIYAPISGVVASVSTQEGETVTASFSTPTFVTIIDLTRLEVWAYVDETDIGRISSGQNASFTVDTYTDTDFKGAVTAIYPKAEIQDNVVNYVTVLKISETGNKILRPEMTTTVDIFLETITNVLAVPNEAIRRELGRKYVYCLEDGSRVKKWVKTGRKDNRYWEILEGLDKNDKVIVGEEEI